MDELRAALLGHGHLAEFWLAAAIDDVEAQTPDDRATFTAAAAAAAAVYDEVAAAQTNLLADLHALQRAVPLQSLAQLSATDIESALIDGCRAHRGDYEVDDGRRWVRLLRWVLTTAPVLGGNSERHMEWRDLPDAVQRDPAFCESVCCQFRLRTEVSADIDRAIREGVLILAKLPALPAALAAGAPHVGTPSGSVITLTSTAWACHGSPPGNWGSIVRRGLLAGGAEGVGVRGIYLTRSRVLWGYTTRLGSTPLLAVPNAARNRNFFKSFGIVELAADSRIVLAAGSRVLQEGTVFAAQEGAAIARFLVVVAGFRPSSM